MAESNAREAAIQNAISLRHAAYGNFGEMNAEVLERGSETGHAASHTWPAHPSQYRLIHTPDTTVIITDGLSDPFREPARDLDLEFNGFSLELYAEFQGRHSLEELDGHYCFNMLGQVCNAVTGLGNFSEVMDQYGYVGLNLYGGGAFPEAYNGPHGVFGVFVGGKSAAVPHEITLNLEKVRLVSVRLLTHAQLIEATDRDTGGAYRDRLQAEFTSDGSHACGPFSF